MYLYDKLEKYGDSDYYGFHMPGHKRNKTLTGADLPYGIDITEIEGFDDLHHANGILEDAQRRAAALFGSQETHFLINGSTAGILSAILGCTGKGDKILIARNCHKSVYHAIFLNELEAVYIYPAFYRDKELNGPVDPEEIEAILDKNPEIKAVMITSPTYDGVVSDVKAIAGIVHAHGIPLLVDEAHGAHFGFHPYFPENAITCRADVVIHSIHKTLPALTQTALIHINGDLVNREKIRKYLQIVQTSSPSYILMAGIDVCVKLLEEKRQELFDAYVERLEKTREELEKLRHLKILMTECFDRSKIIISVKDTSWTSLQLYDRLLKKYHLQMEMAAGSYVLAMTSAGDTDEGMKRLVRALLEIDEEIDKETETVQKTIKGELFALPYLEAVYSSAQIDQIVQEGNKGSVLSLPWEACVGYISTEYAYLYPPGIPLIVPGERISSKVVSILKEYDRIEFEIQGTKEQGKIEVWKNE